MPIFSRTGGRRLDSLLLLCWLLCFFVVPCRPAAAEVVDRFPEVANAFASTTTASAVRAVYEASQLTWAGVNADTPLVPFQSSSYVLCQAVSPPPTATVDAATAAIAAAWCTAATYGGRAIAQTVNWSTLASPGLQLLDQSTTTYRALAWDCITYSCDTENLLSTTSAAAAAMGGLSVGTPCCGTTNSTFVLYMTRGLVVQANRLPVRALNREALQLAQAYAASLTTPLLNLTAAMDYCLLRQLAPDYALIDGAAELGVGDGGVRIAVDPAICGVDVSDRIDTAHATLAMSGYNLILVTAGGVEELAFPRELIVSMLAWIAHQAGTAFGTFAAGESLRRHRNACAWHYKTAYANAYRTGEYVECTVTDPALLRHLPPLVLRVRNESIIDTEDTNSSCSFAIDLSACVNAAGTALRFYSTGSLADAMASHKDLMVLLKVPPIVMGVQHLRGATLAVTREAHISKWTAPDFSLGSGLPLMYMAVPRGTLIAAEGAASASSWFACVQPQRCVKRQIAYPSLNFCATPQCANVFLYSFDPETFQCSVRVSTVSFFGAMCVALILAEVAVLYLRRSTEQAKEDHMRLVLAVQRREAEAQ